MESIICPKQDCIASNTNTFIEIPAEQNQNIVGSTIRKLWTRDAPTVLVIDDDLDQVQLYTALLSIERYNVLGATEIPRAREIIKKRRLDCIVCDIIMPNIDGLDLLKEIRKSKNGSAIPIIMLTAGREDLEMESLKLGADMFCLKKHAQRYLAKQVRLLVD